MTSPFAFLSLLLFLFVLLEADRCLADSSRYESVGNQIRISDWWDDDGDANEFHVVLKRKIIGDIQWFHLIRFDRSAEGPITKTEWRRVFRHIPVEANLRDMRDPGAIGSIYVHPDRAPRNALVSRIDSSADEIQEVIVDEIRALIRFESRAFVFRAAVRSVGISEHALRTCLTALEDAESSGSFYLPTIDGVPPGGSRSAAVYESLFALGSRPGNSATWTDRVVLAAEPLDLGSWKAKFLSEMIGRASLQSILTVVRTVKGVGQKYDVLNELAASELALKDANLVAATIPIIESSSYEARALKRLVGKAATDALLTAVESLSSSSSKADVLSALVDQTSGDLTSEDANKIAIAASSVESTTHRSKLLATLIGKAEVEVLVDAANTISSATTRCEFLILLITGTSLTKEQAGRIADAAADLNSSTNQVRLLATLIGIAAPSRIVDAASKIPSVSGRVTVLEDLAGSPDLAVADADRIVAAASRLSSTSASQKLLVKLADRSSLPAMLAAVEALNSASGKFNVLMALARKPNLTVEEADRIAAVSPQVRSPTYQSRLLVALVGSATPDAIRATADTITSSAARARVRRALNR